MDRVDWSSRDAPSEGAIIIVFAGCWEGLILIAAPRGGSKAAHDTARFATHRQRWSVCAKICGQSRRGAFGGSIVAARRASTAAAANPTALMKTTTATALGVSELRRGTGRKRGADGELGSKWTTQ
jgi:hypothetical protein